jgi:hypothetical protein
MTTYKNNITYHVKKRTATAVSPRLSLVALPVGLPTQPQTDSLDEARVPDARVFMHSGVLRAGPTQRPLGEPLDPGAARDSRGRVHRAQACNLVPQVRR